MEDLLLFHQDFHLDFLKALIFANLPQMALESPNIDIFQN